MAMSLKISGLEELRNDLEKATRLCPERAEKALKKSGNKFKKRVRELVRQEVESDKNLTKGFSITAPKQAGDELSVEFSAEGKKNPHWHLIEEGHDIIMPFKRNGVRRKDGGEKRGYVKGIKVLPKARNEHRNVFEKDIQDMVDDILREVDLQ